MTPIFFITSLLLVSGSLEFDPLLYVDPLTGTANDGHVFPGATVPYGMAKPGADVDDPNNNHGGFVPGHPVTGFSNLHDSGTGGYPSLGNFPLFPHPTCPGDDLNRCKFPKQARAIPYVEDSLLATPGYFKLQLENQVTVEMTSTHHTSLFRFTFPNATESDEPNSPLILLDLTDLSNSRQDTGMITVDPDTGRMIGQATFKSSFAASAYRAYFCADFRGGQIRDTGIYLNTRASSDLQFVSIPYGHIPGGGFIRFNSGSMSSILVRVGLSFMSESQACENAEKEIPHYGFGAVKAASESQWRKKLSPIKIDDSGTMVNPQDYTNENPHWKDQEPYFDSFYCLWDSFRSQLPFLTIVDPKALASMVRSLISTYKHEGWLPDCRMTFSKGYTQGGSNADMVLADAYVKGIKDGIDWELGYEAVVKDAEVEPFKHNIEGRGHLDSWKTLGYIPVEDFDSEGFGILTGSLSRTLEYSANDFAIAQMASRLGKTEDAQKYTDRSSNWKNVFSKSTDHYLGPDLNKTFHGFFQPKYSNQTWMNQDVLLCSKRDKRDVKPCSGQLNGPETYESSIWEYGFYVPHDQGSLMKLYNGQVDFTNRLEVLHEAKIGDIGNEPSFLTVFQYHYAGRPGLSTKRVHYYVGENSRFTAARDGIPGNDDSGAMGSFVAFCMMGFFPNPGQNVYLITTPFFRKIEITSPTTRKTAAIEIENFDPSYKSIYIQNATLNGKDYRKNWITHEFFTDGGKLILNVGPKESLWGTRVEDVPYSLGDYPAFQSERLFDVLVVPPNVQILNQSESSR